MAWRPQHSQAIRVIWDRELRPWNRAIENLGRMKAPAISAASVFCPPMTSIRTATLWVATTDISRIERQCRSTQPLSTCRQNAGASLVLCSVKTTIVFPDRIGFSASRLFVPASPILFGQPAAVVVLDYSSQGCLRAHWRLRHQTKALAAPSPASAAFLLACAIDASYFFSSLSISPFSIAVSFPFAIESSVCACPYMCRVKPEENPNAKVTKTEIRSAKVPGIPKQSLGFKVRNRPRSPYSIQTHFLQKNLLWFRFHFFRALESYSWTAR